MKENKGLIIFLGVGVIVLLGILFYFNDGPTQKPINWEENYKSDNKDPFGAFVIYKMLENYNKEGIEEIKTTPIHKTLSTKEGTGNYILIGDDIYINEASKDTLLRFVESGNTAFIASKNFPDTLMNAILTGHCNEWSGHYSHNDSVVTMNFNHDNLVSKQGYTFKVPEKKFQLNIYNGYNWQGINGDYFCDSARAVTHLGYIKERDTSNYVNFIQIPYGKGKFLFHTNPIVFTNYYLKNPSGREYAEKAITHLGPGKIYWDEYSKLPYIEDSEAQSPLKFILANKSLKYAWYLTLLLVIVYIIFFAKRKQRIIPILEQNSNTSLEFTKTIGALYFQQNNHRRLMQLKLRLFLNYIRQRYHLPTNNVNADLIKKISTKSNISYDHIDSIMKELNLVNRYDLQMTPNDLIRLHQSLDFFYKNCK